MQTNEKILIHRLLWVLADSNSNLDAETAELILWDLCKVTGKTQNQISAMIEELTVKT